MRIIVRQPCTNKFRPPYIRWAKTVRKVITINVFCSDLLLHCVLSGAFVSKLFLPAADDLAADINIAFLRSSFQGFNIVAEALLIFI